MDSPGPAPVKPAPADPLSGGTIDDIMQGIAADLGVRWRAGISLVYLFSDVSRTLVLRGAAGCLPGLVGQSRIRVGDGMAGAAFAEGVPLHSVNIQKEAGYIPFEEKFGWNPAEPCAELAIPVLRGEEGVGVVILLRSAAEPFAEKEINDVRADIARHAGTLEMAKALYMVAEKETTPVVETGLRRTVHGTAVDDRVIAIGRALVATRERAGDVFQALRDRKRALPRPSRTFAEGVDFTIRQLARYQEEIGTRLPEAAKLLFDAQILILKDELFVGRIQQAVDDGDDIAHALGDVALDFTTFFRTSGAEFLAEKAHDVEDVAVRLLHNIYSPDAPDSPREASSVGRVLFTNECYPSDIFRVIHDGIRGLVLIGPGSTAHVALLVKSMGIPTILADDAGLLQVPDGVTVVLNGPTGDILVDPEPSLLRNFEESAVRSRDVGLQHVRARPETRTRDGVRVHLLANVNLISEASAAMEAQAEGVGLYRTEFPFLLHPSLPNEQDQVELYGKLLDAVPDRPVTFRTLDAGGDKVLSYFQPAKEENPALGLRSTRFTLRYPYIFDQQLRAILLAAHLRHRADIRIMFPMIGSVEEYDAAVQRVEYCLETLPRRYALEGEVVRPEIGTMVELPALVHLADFMARRAAFFSIGTNDFIQYMLAVDRTNAAVCRYYIPHHPAVLHGLARVAAAGVRAGIPVSVCGEMGHDPRFLPFFLGIGIRHFSLDPTRIADIQQAVSRISIEEAERAAAGLLTCETIADTERLLS